MSQIIGNKETPKLGLKDTTALKCTCGNSTFVEGMLLRKISAILSPKGVESLSPITILICHKCSSPLEQMLPEELKD